MRKGFYKKPFLIFLVNSQFVCSEIACSLHFFIHESDGSQFITSRIWTHFQRNIGTFLSGSMWNVTTLKQYHELMSQIYQIKGTIVYTYRWMSMSIEDTFLIENSISHMNMNQSGTQNSLCMARAGVF